MPAATTDHNLWELAVLALLREQPMHPYLMQRLLHERHKDELLVLKRGSLYHAIERLLKLSLIEPVGTGRSGRRPERTTYRSTPAGRQMLLQWIQRMISLPAQETSQFMAAMSFMVHLTPRDATPRLEERMRRLEQLIADLKSVITLLMPRVKRINLIESEYLRAMREAELAWIRGLLAQIRAGRFVWDPQGILREARRARTAPAATHRLA